MIGDAQPSPFLIDRGGNFPDVPLNKDTSKVQEGARYVAEVAEEIAEVVPDEHKSEFKRLARNFKYVAPECQAGCWAALTHGIGRIVPSMPKKLEHDWQVKAVSLLTNKPEDFIRKNFKE